MKTKLKIGMATALAVACSGMFGAGTNNIAALHAILEVAFTNQSEGVVSVEKLTDTKRLVNGRLVITTENRVSLLKKNARTPWDIERSWRESVTETYAASNGVVVLESTVTSR